MLTVLFYLNARFVLRLSKSRVNRALMRSHSRNRVLVSSLGDGNPLEYDDVVKSSSDCEQEPLVKDIHARVYIRIIDYIRFDQGLRYLEG
ncbi:hypothetical protein V1477_010946 [Vespula maculifrons]|uniref:Uncharacterized protein n=1 Tax=Vespula maculifrons TaxID=7453 RepID=A0ABD2C3E2_VESMC